VRNHHDDPFGSLIVPPVATDTGGWRNGDLVAYLTIRHADARGTGSGPMGETVDHSLSQLAAEDIRAVVAYLRTVPSIASPDLLAPPTPASYRQDGITADARGMMLFEGACVSCRDLTGGETDLILRDAHRRMGSQRSQRNKCRPRGAFRHRAVDARACRLDAGVRQRLFRFRDRSSCQLRHRALGSKGVASQRAGHRGVEENKRRDKGDGGILGGRRTNRSEGPPTIRARKQLTANCVDAIERGYEISRNIGPLLRSKL
jgi:hypothetical protein